MQNVEYRQVPRAANTQEVVYYEPRYTVSATQLGVGLFVFLLLLLLIILIVMVGRTNSLLQNMLIYNMSRR